MTKRKLTFSELQIRILLQEFVFGMYRNEYTPFDINGTCIEAGWTLEEYEEQRLVRRLQGKA